MLSENNQYLAAFWGIASIILLLFLQWLVATKSKSTTKGAVPGKIDPSLGHESFIFRAHRTFMNTLENIPAMLGCCFLAILVGADPFWTAIFIWLFVAARTVHMILYYAIATDKNPSPRTYFFSFGLFVNVCLFGLCVKTLMSLS
ncbi:MAG: MAPEG family protein [Gammaproteobacteria bacterium]|nr:MAG: MAPEG family protein [Gammaproteobacteria bacterium]